MIGWSGKGSKQSVDDRGRGGDKEAGGKDRNRGRLAAGGKLFSADVCGGRMRSIEMGLGLSGLMCWMPIEENVRWMQVTSSPSLCH